MCRLDGTCSCTWYVVDGCIVGLFAASVPVYVMSRRWVWDGRLNAISSWSMSVVDGLMCRSCQVPVSFFVV